MNFAKGKFVVLLGILASTTLYPISTRSITVRDDVPDSSYLNLGASPDYNTVGRFVSNGGYTGCGTLVAPDWVLTAAHLVQGASLGIFTIGGTSYSSTTFFTDPGWTGNVLDGDDFALVHLSSPVTGVTPAMLYTGSAEFGQVATYVGYGYTGTGLTGWYRLDLRKRACQNVDDSDFGNPSLLMGSYFADPHATADAPPLEGCVAPGDSGGGVFLTIGAQTYLAGVTSFVASTNGTSPNSIYGDFSGAGRVSAADSWITSIIPEPATLALVALSGSSLLLFRRQRK